MSGPDTPPSSSGAGALHAEPGDILVIDGAGMAGLPRTGIVLAVASRDGTPPYLVHWIAGDYDSRIYPGFGARIEKHRLAAAVQQQPV